MSLPGSRTRRKKTSRDVHSSDDRVIIRSEHDPCCGLDYSARL